MARRRRAGSDAGLIGVIIGGLFTMVTGLGVAGVTLLDDDTPPPPPIECVVEMDRMLDLVKEHSGAGRAVLASLKDPDVEDECGDIRQAVLDQAP
ncbi:MAG: hypothetical protein LC808_28245 [Actinobacteria bacterium]|nr:hypothetical protein [Actinomycetota bacterium]